MTFAVPACQYELLWQIYLKHMPACIFLALFKMIDERTSVPNPLKPSNKFISLPQNTNIAIIVFFKGRVPFIVLNSLFSEMDTYSSTTTTSFFFFHFFQMSILQENCPMFEHWHHFAGCDNFHAFYLRTYLYCRHHLPQKQGWCVYHM